MTWGGYLKEESHQIFGLMVIQEIAADMQEWYLISF